MRYLLIFFALIFLIIASVTTSKANDVQVKSTEEPRVYPIAPGVWYPGDPLPEKPMRYYRVRCFPGCHRGSSHGKYPNEPLNMRPIFPTSTIDLLPTVPTKAN
ncbi:MAG: hypothetical protein ACETWT_04850 [Thermodesulfobacteriota bacterium]|jgi:hypothetical protein